MDDRELHDPWEPMIGALHYVVIEEKPEPYWKTQGRARLNAEQAEGERR